MIFSIIRIGLSVPTATWVRLSLVQIDSRVRRYLAKPVVGRGLLESRDAASLKCYERKKSALSMMLSVSVRNFVE